MTTSATTGTWKGRDLENYKEMHQETAKKNGVLDQFMKCKTLTQARKVLFGDKPKKYVATRDAAKV